MRKRDRMHLHVRASVYTSKYVQVCIFARMCECVYKFYAYVSESVFCVQYAFARTECVYKFYACVSESE